MTPRGHEIIDLGVIAERPCHARAERVGPRLHAEFRRPIAGPRRRERGLWECVPLVSSLTNVNGGRGCERAAARAIPQIAGARRLRDRATARRCRDGCRGRRYSRVSPRRRQNAAAAQASNRSVSARTQRRCTSGANACCTLVFPVQTILWISIGAVVGANLRYWMANR